MQITIDGQVLSSVTDEAVLVDLQDEQVRINTAVHKRYDVNVDDRFVVAPESRKLTAEYTLPAFVKDGIFADIDALEADMLAKFADQEIALVNQQNYTDTVADGVRTQVYDELGTFYLSNTGADGRNYIFGLDFAQAKVTTENGAVELSLQDVTRRTLETEDAAAGYTQQLQMYNDNMSAFATKIIQVDAELGDVSASAKLLLEAYAYVDNDGNYQARSIAGLVTDVNDVITGVRVTNSSDERSEVVIMADHFKIVGTGEHAVSAAPFTVDTLTNTVGINGNLIVGSISGSEGRTVFDTDNERIDILDTNGNLRVRVGKLTE